MSNITEERAREIAGLWHGGQSTALYAFSSSGAILSYINSEIEECLRVVYPHDHDSDHKKELLDLRSYITSRQED